MNQFEREVVVCLSALYHEARVQTEYLKHIAHCVCRHARSASLFFVLPNGEKITMPLTVHVNDNPGTASFQEWSGPNGTGINVPPVGAVTFASDNTAVATVDSSTGALAYIGAGVANISGTDAGNSLTASDVLTVSAATAVSATLTLSPGL